MNEELFRKKFEAIDRKQDECVILELKKSLSQKIKDQWYQMMLIVQEG